MKLKSATRDASPSQIYLAAWTLYAGYYMCRKGMGETGNGISHFAFGLACFAFTYAIGQIVGGILADRFGGRRTALTGAAISIVCTLLLAWCSHPTLGLLLQLGNGLGQGFGWPSLLKLIGSSFGREERDHVLGWWSASYILGGLLASSLAAWLIVSTYAIAGSRFSPIYFVSSVIFFCAAAFFYATTSETSVPASGGQPVVARGWFAAQRGEWAALLSQPSMRFIAGMYFFLKMTRYTLLFWLPQYLITSVGYGVHGAEHTASYFELCGFIGPLAVGYTTRRWFRGRYLAFGACLLFSLAFVCLLHPVLANNREIGMVVSISLMGILIHGADLLMSGIAVLDAAPQEMHGRAVGLVNGVGSIGQMLSPILATVFVARLGWAHLFDLFVFFAIVAGAICAAGAHQQTPRLSQAEHPGIETADLSL